MEMGLFICDLSNSGAYFRKDVFLRTLRLGFIRCSLHLLKVFLDEGAELRVILVVRIPPHWMFRTASERHTGAVVPFVCRCMTSTGI